MRTGKEVGDASPIVSSLWKSSACNEPTVCWRRGWSPLGLMTQGFLGRLFRLGGSSSVVERQPAAAPNGRRRRFRTAVILDQPGSSAAASRSRLSAGTGSRTLTDCPRPPVTTPTTAAAGPGQRLGAQAARRARRSRPPIPLLTRFALGRSNDGSQFGMFLQVFADGTVDRLRRSAPPSPADLKPIVELVQSGELYRLTRPLRRAVDGFHRVRARRGLRATAGPADGAFVFVFRQSAGLRPCDPPPAHDARKPSGEAEPPQPGASRRPERRATHCRFRRSPGRDRRRRLSTSRRRPR